MYSIRLLFLLLAFLSTTILWGQSTTPTRFIELGVSTQSYKGDLSHRYSQWNNGIQVGMLWNKKKRINGHLNLLVGSASAQNPNYFFDDGSTPQPTPVKYVKVKMIAANYDLHLNLYKKHNLIVYLYQGIGLLRFDLRDEENKKLSESLATRAPGESFSNLGIMLPNGLGALYTTKPGFGVGFQVGWLNSMTDYLDNTSEWGNLEKKDNVLVYKMTFYIPFTPKKNKPVKTGRYAAPKEELLTE